MTEDLPLTIPAAALSEHLACPVCFDPMRKCLLIAVCGHRFCGDCIKECINIKHACPLCKAECNPAHLVPDHQFDALCEMIRAEQEKSESLYFSSLIRASVTGQVAPLTDAKTLSPIEDLFCTQLKGTLAVYNRFLQNIKTRAEQAMYAARQRNDDALDDGRALDDDLAAIAKNMADCEEKLLEAYEAHLQCHLPLPSLVSAPVILSAPSLDFRKAIVLRPGTSLPILKGLFLDGFSENGLKVESLGDDVQICLTKPFSEDTVPLTDDFVSHLHDAIEPNTLFSLVGTVQLCRPRCFKDQYDQEKPEPVDYYSCDDCNFNWICSTCRQCCHKGHKTKPYILQHQPKWACCYCPKKGSCGLKESG